MPKEDKKTTNHPIKEVSGFIDIFMWLSLVIEIFGDSGQTEK